MPNQKLIRRNYKLWVFRNASDPVAEHPVDSHFDHAHDSRESAELSDRLHAAAPVEIGHASGERHDHAAAPVQIGHVIGELYDHATDHGDLKGRDSQSQETCVAIIFDETKSEP